MGDRIVFTSLWLVVFLLLLFGGVAHAETVKFMCRTEEAANQIAEAISMKPETVDEVTDPLIALGECKYLPEEMFVYVVQTGQTFGTTFRITVLGLAHKIGEFPDMWGLKATDTHHEDGSI